MIISHSRIKMWKNNHYDHYQKYIKKIVPKEKGQALIRGSIIHDCLEAYYEGRSWKKVWKKFQEEYYQGLFEEEKGQKNDIAYMANELLEAYFHYYEQEDSETEFLFNELHFELDLIEDVKLEGYIDAVIVDKNGDIWVKDYKTYRSMPTYDSLRFNYQSAIYIWALEQMGYTVKGMIWDIITAKTPSKPQLLKNGEVSKRALDSNPYTVEKGLIELGLDPEEHLDLIESVKFENYFQRIKIRNTDFINAMMDDIRDTAWQIKEYGHIFKDMNLETKFNSPYLPLWQAEVNGGDIDFVIETQYEKKGNGRDGNRK